MSRVEVSLSGGKDPEKEQLLETVKRMEEQQNEMLRLIKSLAEKGGSEQ